MFFSLIYYFIFGLILFFLIDYIKLKNKTFNSFLPIILIYLVVISSIITNKDILNNIYLVVVVEFFIRLFYNLVVLTKDNDENLKFIYEYILYIVCSLILNNIFINKVDNVFLEGESLKIVVWILIVLYLFKNIDIFNISSVTEEHIVDNSKYREYIVTNYAKFKNLYNNDIEIESSIFKNLLYAMMIYEDKKKNKFLRSIDNLFVGKFNKEYKMGIMQVPSKVYLTDLESIKIAINKLNKTYTKYFISDDDILINKMLKDYYKDDLIIKNVTYIYSVIKEFIELK